MTERPPRDRESGRPRDRETCRQRERQGLGPDWPGGRFQLAAGTPARLPWRARLLPSASDPPQRSAATDKRDTGHTDIHNQGIAEPTYATTNTSRHCPHLWFHSTIGPRSSHSTCYPGTSDYQLSRRHADLENVDETSRGRSRSTQRCVHIQPDPRVWRGALSLGARGANESAAAVQVRTQKSISVCTATQKCISVFTAYLEARAYSAKLRISNHLVSTPHPSTSSHSPSNPTDTSNTFDCPLSGPTRPPMVIRVRCSWEKHEGSQPHASHSASKRRPGN